MNYVRPLTEMLDLCITFDPCFTDLENLAFLNGGSDQFVYLLGVCFCTNDVEGIKAFARSRLWFTYRRNFPAIGGTGPTSDRGWGCMLRCGQMLLAHALSLVHLGRNWQWNLKCPDSSYRRLLSMFADKRTSLFSIHQIAQMGVSEGKPLGEWFGPNTIAQVLKKLTVYDTWSNLAVHIAMDNILISDDVRIMAAHEVDDESLLSEKSCQWKRPVLIIVPLRLGLTVINGCYSQAIKEFFKLPQCAGIVGGRPNHAVYFFGQADNKLLYLDPHVCHDVVDISFNETKPGQKDALGAILASTSLMTTPPSTVQSPLLMDVDQVEVFTSSVVSSTVENSIAPSYEKCDSELYEDASIRVEAPFSESSNKCDEEDLGDNFSSCSSSSLDVTQPSYATGGNSSFSSRNTFNNSVEHSYISEESSSKNSYSVCASKPNDNESGRNDETDSDGFASCTDSPEALRFSNENKLGDLETKPQNKMNKVICSSYSTSSSSSTEMLSSAVRNNVSKDFTASIGKNVRSPRSKVDMEMSYVNCESPAHAIIGTESDEEDETAESGNYPFLKLKCKIGKNGTPLRKKHFKKRIRGHSNREAPETSDDNSHTNNCGPTSWKSTINTSITLALPETIKTIDEKLSADVAIHYESNILNEIDDESIINHLVAEMLSLVVVNCQKETEMMDSNIEMDNNNKLPAAAEEDNFDDSTFHCSYILHMDFETLDPSLALAFVCLCEEDYNDLIERLNNSVLNASSPPLFEILENRPAGWPPFVPYALHDESLKMKEYYDFGDPQFDSDDQFEILE